MAVQTQRALLYGAGQAGHIYLRELRHHPEVELEIVGFIDDDPTKVGTEVFGVPVLGDGRALEQIVQDYDVNLVVIAIPSASGRVIQPIVQACRRLGARTRTLPGLYEILSGEAVIQSRQLKIDDLLRREPVVLDLDAARELLKGRSVAVTGAAGSIGSQLCRQLAALDAGHLELIDNNETGLFELEHKLRSLQPQSADRVSIALADVTDSERIEAVFKGVRPTVVFHAAAYKHVPILEQFPEEAARVNVLGTANVVDAARRAGVERFVFVSTDKAVGPCSVMGLSKRLSEHLAIGTDLAGDMGSVAVRFGNVLGSRGSVVGVFERQIADGGPITVTDPHMERFFMTIPEAYSLIVAAAALGGWAGMRRLYVLDMGEPVRIVDLAHDMLRMKNLRPGKDVRIEFTGSRPGERLREGLHESFEEIHDSEVPRVREIRLRSSALSADRILTTVSEAIARKQARRGMEELYRQLCAPPAEAIADASRRRAVTPAGGGG
jgi:FlaA1/EpsC-like NDP-sugar epimerase